VLAAAEERQGHQLSERVVVPARVHADEDILVGVEVLEQPDVLKRASDAKGCNSVGG